MSLARSATVVSTTNLLTDSTTLGICYSIGNMLLSNWIYLTFVCQFAIATYSRVCHWIVPLVDGCSCGYDPDYGNRLALVTSCQTILRRAEFHVIWAEHHWEDCNDSNYINVHEFIQFEQTNLTHSCSHGHGNGIWRSCGTWSTRLIQVLQSSAYGEWGESHMSRLLVLVCQL